MLLKSLQLHGFKTFSDKTLLSFDRGITVVVGPNGSGKSNISDSIRWVLGEQSAKTLRCSKMEDVVFNGTPIKRAQGFAEVVLTIDNKERKFQIDSDEVVITRRYHRSGESEYLINQNLVRLKDIHELLMDTGLGRDGYSIISQGKIDGIVASKSEDRREIFEEAAGISRFRYRKADAEKRLEQAKENIVRLDDIIKELEDRVGPLKEQSEKAMAYITFSDEKKKLEISIWTYTIEKSAKILNEHEEKMSISRAQYEKIEEDIQNISSQTELSFQKSNSCVSKVDETRRKISKLEEEASDIKNKISVLQNDILHNKENIKRIENEIEESSKSSEDLDALISQRNLQIADLKNSIEKKRVELGAYTCDLENLQKSFDFFSETNEKHASELSSLSVKESELKIKIITSESTIQDLTSRVANMDSNMNLLKENISDTKSLLDDYTFMNEQVQKFVGDLENSLSGYKLKLDLKKKKIDELKSVADRLTLDSEDKIRRIRMLEELERNLEGFTNSVKLIMKESDRGVLSGIYGPVSRIIKVKEKYSTAIGTALGSAMQNIVVETEADAKKAIMLLKRKNVGRATFLPLSTIKGTKLFQKDVEKCRGFIGIASDLCSVEPKYSEIVLSILGRIVVAEDIDCAIEISKKFNYKFRVVTLDGQVVNMGGSLTGGSITKGSGLLSRAIEIKKMNEEYEKLKENAKNSRLSLRIAQEELSKIESDFLGTQGELSRKRDECFRISTECKQTLLNLKNYESSYKNLENEKNSSQTSIKKFSEEKLEAESEMRDIVEKIKKVESEIKINSESRDKLLLKRDSLSQDIQKISLKIFSDEKDITSFEYEVKSIEERKVSSTRKIRTLKNQIDEADKYTQSLQKKIQQLEAKSSEVKDQMQSCEKKILELNEERMSFEKKITDLRKMEREKINEREIVSRDLSKLEERKINLQKEYDVIIGKLWDEYELTKSEAEKLSVPIDNIVKANSKLAEVKNSIKKLGNINVGAIEEYKEVSERYGFMTEQVNDVRKSKNELNRLINELTDQMKEMFALKLKQINENFKIAFTDLFGGGEANITLSDPTNILTSGIEIEVQPPGKIVNRLEALSGGERALIAISLYFAIMQVNPPPFCVLDEIEAALDDVNVYRFASYLRKINDNTQFIVISHRRGTMEEADVLYGVTMQDEGVSKLLKLNASEMEKKLNLK